MFYAVPDGQLHEWSKPYSTSLVHEKPSGMMHLLVCCPCAPSTSVVAVSSVSGHAGFRLHAGKFLVNMRMVVGFGVKQE